MPVTISDVARHAGVSKTTVSRVLNDKGELTESTVQKVRAAISELGYVPSAGAIGLARGRTQQVGMFVPSLTWPWIGAVLEGVVDLLEEAQFGLRLLSFNRGEESLRRLGLQVAAKSFDGLIVIEPRGTLDYITQLHREGLPVVLIDDRGHRPQFPHVGTTNRAGGEEAARHLLNLGRRRPLIVSGPPQHGCTQERLDGFAEIYAAAGLRIEAGSIINGDFTFEGGRDAVRQAIAAGREIDAVFAHNDVSAAGALVALREAGLQVPKDVAVVGFDDVPLASFTDPGLTTIHQPLREMGEAAADLLLACMRGTPEPTPSRIIPTRLVVRASTTESAQQR